MKSRSIHYLALALLGFTLQARAGEVTLDFGAGFSRSSAPTLATRSSDTLIADEKAVGEDFSGFHLFLTLGIPLRRWFALQATISGAFESGAVVHPKTVWSGAPNVVAYGYAEDAGRKTYSYSAGIRIQDQDSPWRITPWAYAMTGLATQSMELSSDSSLAGSIFYENGSATQIGLVLALGLGVDAKLVGQWGLRLGVEYQPIFLGDKEVLVEGERRTLQGRDITARQSARFVGETMHDVRVVVGPRFGF